MFYDTPESVNNSSVKDGMMSVVNKILKKLMMMSSGIFYFVRTQNIFKSRMHFYHLVLHNIL